MPTWASYLIGAVIAVVIAVLVAPLIPAPGGSAVAVIAWVVAAILVVLALVSLIRRPGV
jgi:hypothetical protein